MRRSPDVQHPTESLRRGRFLSLVLTAVLAAVTSTALASDISDWERDFSLRFSAVEAGSIALIGNTSLTCDEELTPDTCDDARQGEAEGSANNNNQHWMRMVDVDGDPTTFNSSAATLTLRARGGGGLSAGSGEGEPEVLWAGLYWGADTNRRAVHGQEGLVAPDPTAIGEVLFTVPGAANATTVSASVCNQRPSGAERDYMCFADVTSLIPDDPDGLYTVANLQTGQGGNRYAGWSLVIVYRDPAEPTRNLTVFDGFRNISATNNEAIITVEGFLTPPFGPVRTRLGVVAWEGDRAQIGSRVVLEGVELSEPLRPSNNFFNTSITRFGLPVADRVPDWPNTMGIDIALLAVDGILPNDATSAEILLRTTAGTYFTGAVAFATEIFAPQPTVLKTYTNLDGGDNEPGDRIRYTLEIRNDGFDVATAITLTDTLDPALILDPDTILVNDAPAPDAVWNNETRRLELTLADMAPGARTTVTFEINLADTITPGQPISNQAVLDYRADTLDRDFRRISSDDPDVAGQPTVLIADDNPPEIDWDLPADEAILATLRPTFSGTGEPGATVTLTFTPPTGAPITASTSIGEDGAWTYTPEADLTEGELFVDVYAEDRIGNRTTLDSRSFTLDVTPPPLTITNPEANAVLFAPILVTTGTSEPGARIELAILNGEQNVIQQQDATTGASGQWIQDFAALDDGVWTLTATAFDLAGNGSEAHTRTFTIDTRAPLLELDSPADGLRTRDAGPTVAGRTDPDASLVLRLTGPESIPDVAVPVDSVDGAFVWNPPTPLAEGPWTLSLTAERPNGRTATVERSFTIVRTGPPLDVLRPTEGAQVFPDEVVFEGLTDPGAAVALFLDDSPLSAISADGDGRFLVTPTTPLEPGERSLRVTASDDLGNETTLEISFEVVPRPEPTEPEPTEPEPSEPGTSESGSSEPGSSEPGSFEPGSSEPGSSEPGSSEPGASEPGASEPGASEPGSSEPGASEPGASEPGASEPGASEPGSSGPGASEPGASEPGASEPGASEPGASEPGSSEPGASEPGASEPGSSEPGSSEPGTSEPGASEPSSGGVGQPSPSDGRGTGVGTPGNGTDTVPTDGASTDELLPPRTVGGGSGCGCAAQGSLPATTGTWGLVLAGLLLGLRRRARAVRF